MTQAAQQSISRRALFGAAVALPAITIAAPAFASVARQLQQATIWSEVNRTFAFLHPKGLLLAQRMRAAGFEFEDVYAITLLNGMGVCCKRGERFETFHSEDRV